MREIWKDIDGYENLYKISNLGNVKRIKKNDDTIADRVAKIKERQDRLEFKNNLLLCIIKSLQQKEGMINNVE